jgi:hypothetical protein
VNLFGEPDKPRAEQLTFGGMIQSDGPPPVAPWPEPPAAPPTPPAATPRPEPHPPEVSAALARWRRWTARPWAATTAADRRIARQFKADETPPLISPEAP